MGLEVNGYRSDGRFSCLRLIGMWRWDIGQGVLRDMFISCLTSEQGYLDLPINLIRICHLLDIAPILGLCISKISPTYSIR